MHQRSISSFFGPPNSQATAKKKVKAETTGPVKRERDELEVSSEHKRAKESDSEIDTDHEIPNAPPPLINVKKEPKDSDADVSDTSELDDAPSLEDNIPVLAIPKSVKKEQAQQQEIQRHLKQEVEEMTSKIAKAEEPIQNISFGAWAKYDPIKHASWKRGESVPYIALTNAFVEIAQNSGRLKKTEIMTNLFRSIIALTPQDLVTTVYLSINTLGADYLGTELGIGESILINAICAATGRNKQSVKKTYNELGDLGLVAQASRTTQKTLFPTARLTIPHVYRKLKEIAMLQGDSSVSKKKDIIQSLLVSSKESEAQFIIKSLQGKLRIGLQDKTVINALANAVILTPPHGGAPPSNNAELERALKHSAATLNAVYCEVPNYDIILPVLLNEGVEAMRKKCYLTPGIPVKPMLAQPTKNGVSEVLDRFSDSTFTCEFKYDGERAQIHYWDGNTKIYSRNLEDNTEKFPDIISYMPQIHNEGVTSFILDCEVVAYDKVTNKILPFQILTTRARKKVIIDDIKVQVCLFAFDLLYVNGKSLLQTPLLERRKLLHDNLKAVPGIMSMATYRDLTDTEDIQNFLQEAVEGNCEGLMVKTLEKDATYEPSKRSYKWLKIKKDYIEGMGDSLDLVVIGAYIGRGKRSKGYGGYLLACYDEETETYQSVSKIGTGFSDEDLATQFTFFSEHVISNPKPYYSFGEGVRPDVWFEPVQVWEILTADLSVSPVHKAGFGVVEPNKGIALRFPRFVRIRPDKTPEQATTSTQVVEMFNKQKINRPEQEDKGKKKGKKKGDKSDEEESEMY